jgi:hypothetical protein
VTLLSIGGPPVLASTAQGVTAKPNSCRVCCPYFSVGEGYVTDYLPEAPRVMLLVANPSADDLVNREILSGKAGYSFLKTYIWPLGYKKEDIGIAAIMRCRPKGGRFPIGADKRGVLQGCRQYDKNAIGKFNPDTYMITQTLFDTYTNPAFGRLLKNDIAKAFRLADKGLRPIVLMGVEAASMVAPYIDGNGGPKAWRSHWQALDNGWPFLMASSKPKEPVGFAPARHF